jgi:hypothetical protein
LPPLVGEYITAPGAHAAIYTGAGLQISLQDIHYRATLRLSNLPFGSDEIETYDSMLQGTGRVNLDPPFAANTTGISRSVAHNKVGNIIGTFNTEMLSMDLAGTSAYGPYMIRESPTLASTGQTTITDIGGGLYHIDSFFDVFTELSLDGGATWIPDSAGPERLTLMPEPGSMMMLVLFGGVLAIRRARYR